MKKTSKAKKPFRPAKLTAEQRAAISTALELLPDDMLLSEAGKRRARKRRSYTGGVVWAKHNPQTSRCRCQQCIAKRKGAAA